MMIGRTIFISAEVALKRLALCIVTGLWAYVLFGSATILEGSITPSETVTGNSVGAINTSPKLTPQDSTQAFSVSPSSSVASSETFTFTFSDSSGGTNIAQGHMLITSSNGANACYLMYQPVNNYGLAGSGLYMANDAGTQFSTPVSPGASGTLSNSQCSVQASSVFASISSTSMTVTVTISFMPSFAGNTFIVMNSYDVNWNQSGWFTAGTVTVSLSITVSPYAGSGPTQTFTVAYTSTDQAQEHLIINGVPSGAQSCYLIYDRPSTSLMIASDQGTAVLASAAPGSSAILANDQCSVPASTASVTSSGDTVTIMVTITFLPSFAGAKVMYGNIFNTSYAPGPWQTIGNWTATRVQVLNVHNDQAGTSANTAETALTTSNVTVGQFGKTGVFTCGAGSEYIFAQPLYAPSVAISGNTYNLLIVATLANTVCAFNAYAPGSAPLWSVNFGGGNTNYPGYSSGASFFCGAAIGTVSTPAIDPAGQKIYVCSWDSAGNWWIRVLSLTTGSILSATTVSAQVTGTGDPEGGDTTSGSNLLFYPAKQLQRPGLKLASGNLYVGFGGVGDNHPWHGWIMAYRTSDMTQVGVFCTTPNSYGGAIWGGEPTIDAVGNLYLTTGNGEDYDPSSATYTDSVLKLSPTLSLMDWFTPSNNAAINAVDADTSANRIILIPGTNLLAATGAKDFNVYVLDANCMGHLQGSNASCALQRFQTENGTVTNGSGSYGATFINNSLFMPLTNGHIYAYAWEGSSFNTTPFANDQTSYGIFGPSAMSSSANGTTNAIVWVTTTAAGLSSFSSTYPGTLRARSGGTLAELWNSDQSGNDTLGLLAKYAAPTIVNGFVYVATQSGYVAAYGLTAHGSADR
jgi:hypothetical protein